MRLSRIGSVEERHKQVTMTKAQVVAVALVIVVALGGSIWQQIRVSRLETENRNLRRQVRELSPLRPEVERLRKTDVDRAELERLRRKDSQQQLELAQLRDRASRVQRSESEAAELKQELDRQKDSSPGTNFLTGAMKGMIEQQLLGQLGRMKTKLNLTLDQEQAIREILLKQVERGTEMAQKLLSGKIKKEEMAELAKSDGNPKEQIKALLTPEQQAAYEEYQKEEAVGNARLAANAEMLQMQNVLGLTQEQQDKVFPVLYDHTLKQISGDSAPKDGNVAAWFEGQIDRKVKALEGILTPEQLASYRQMQEQQAQMFKTILPAGNPPPPK
jgi:hypothetical protein